MRLYIGTYSEPILFGTGEILQGKGEGIYCAKMDCERGVFSLAGLAIRAKNPSFLAQNKAGNALYAVNELKEYQGEKQGSVSSFTVEEDGSLHQTNILPTKGQDPCQVYLSNDETVLVVSNFMTGSVCSYKLAPNFSLSAIASFEQHQGSGADPKRQAGPHAHSCIETPDHKYLLVPDLGADALMIYEKSENSTICLTGKYQCMPGSGPRYGEFHQNGTWFYLIHELSSTIAFLEYQTDGSLALKATYSTLKSPQEGNICADLHITPDGKFLYASNRGDDSIVMFEIDEQAGVLQLLGWVSSGGKTPRQFAIMPNGKYICVGNQDSDNITVFSISNDGMLQQVQQVAVPTPVCILPWNGTL